MGKGVSIIVIQKIPKKLAKLGFVLTLVILIAGVICADWTPAHLYTQQVQNISLSLPLPATAVPQDTLAADTGQTQTGYDATVKLFGIIPIGSTRVSLTQPDQVIVGGTFFGIKIMAQGVLVVDFRDVETKEGNQNPAKEAGVCQGDLVLAVNDRSVTTNSQLQSLVANCEGKPIRLLIQRDGKTQTLTLQPVLSSDGSYRIGMWVRDSTAGLGTMTFYHPATNTYGGLGHAVCDTDTGKPLTVLTGEIVTAQVDSIQKGRTGTAGEIRGSIISNRPLGSLTVNSSCGVFGTVNTLPENGKLVAVAYKQEVKEGDAVLITSVEGQPKEYACTIEKVVLKETTTRNLVIRITDQELLEQTGGIIQGMSGSPILQNGKLVGAVTHVFVNDPTAGYGVFAETMLESAITAAQEQDQKAS